MDFATGDIITATISGNPYYRHKGIILIEKGKVMVAHNTPARKNNAGGNVLVEPLDDFLAAGRSIVSRNPSGITQEQIIKAVEAIRKARFHFLDFNCRDFIFFVRTGKRRKSKKRLLKTFFRSVSVSAGKPRAKRS